MSRNAFTDLQDAGKIIGDIANAVPCNGLKCMHPKFAMLMFEHMLTTSKLPARVLLHSSRRGAIYEAVVFTCTDGSLVLAGKDVEDGKKFFVDGNAESIRTAINQRDLLRALLLEHHHELSNREILALLGPEP